eukprot:SAG31_NODE_363_length_16899_cov_9.812976_3_plen_160_part_00
MQRAASAVVYAVERSGSRFSICLAPAVGHGSFVSFVRADQGAGLVRFIRAVLHAVEGEQSCRNYHLRLQPGVVPAKPRWRQLGTPGLVAGTPLMAAATAAGFHVAVFGDNEKQGEPVDAESLSQMDTPINYVDKGGTHVELPVTQRDITGVRSTLLYYV